MVTVSDATMISIIIACLLIGAICGMSFLMYLEKSIDKAFKKAEAENLAALRLRFFLKKHYK